MTASTGSGLQEWETWAQYDLCRVAECKCVIDCLIQANGESAHIDLHKAKGRMRLNLRH